MSRYCIPTDRKRWFCVVCDEYHINPFWHVGHIVYRHYTVPQFENHDRWKVKRFFQCLTQNDRPQTSSILSPGSAWLLWSRDSSTGQSCSDTVWLMRGPSPWQTAPYRPAFTVCLYEFVCVLLIKWDYNLSLTGGGTCVGSCDKSMELNDSTYQ